MRIFLLLTPFLVLSGCSKEEENEDTGGCDLATASTWFEDADGDGFGNPNTSVQDCEAPTGFVADNTDCNDTDGAYYPGASEEDCTDPNDYNCDGSVGYADADEDGFAACEDCNDLDPNTNPAGSEVCDEADNNCDGTIDEGVKSTWYEDSDSDGFGNAESTTEACTAPDGFTDNSEDCDDAVAQTNPLQFEVCDGIDNDCDGTIDNDDAIDASDWYADTDLDGYGDPNNHTSSCSQPSGYISDSQDCDDTDSAINPDTIWYADADSDGYGDINTTFQSCTQPSGYVLDSQDCEDSDSTLNPDTTWYADSDLDGYGDPNTSTQSCTQPSGYTSDDQDCDDTDADISPDTIWYADADSDGYGDPSTTTQSCTQPSGYVSNADDCDDTDANTNECCPSISSATLTIDGPTDQYGYCWYLGDGGETCDDICSELGGSNYATNASSSFSDSCNSPSSADISTWFFNNGNAAGWTGAGATGYYTLGYGYEGSSYYGKCASGGSMNHGTFPGDPNNSGTRNLVCPCATGTP